MINREKVPVGKETRWVYAISKTAPSLFADLVKVEEINIDCISLDPETKHVCINSFTGHNWHVFKAEQLLALEENYIQEIRLVLMAREFGKTESYMYKVNLYTLKELERFAIKLEYMSQFPR